MTPPPFVSHAQNGEDVVLWRALRTVEGGVYVDVGANDPVHLSVTKAFYDRGWHGLNVEPVAPYVDALRQARPRDIVAAVAVTPDDHGTITLHEIPDTGLSTLSDNVRASAISKGFVANDVVVPTRTLSSLVDEHLGDQDVHFCKIDVEGSEADVIASAGLDTWRPWVLVIEATYPNTADPTFSAWEDTVLAAGYRYCLFDGLSRYYVSEEHADLQEKLSYPACPLDDYAPAHQVALQQELQRLLKVHHEAMQELSGLEALKHETEALRHELVRWRAAAVEAWAEGVTGPGSHSTQQLAEELEAMRQTVSWQVTRPLRAVRSLMGTNR